MRFGTRTCRISYKTWYCRLTQVKWKEDRIECSFREALMTSLPVRVNHLVAKSKSVIQPQILPHSKRESPILTCPKKISLGNNYWTLKRSKRFAHMPCTMESTQAKSTIHRKTPQAWRSFTPTRKTRATVASRVAANSAATKSTLWASAPPSINSTYKPRESFLWKHLPWREVVPSRYNKRRARVR